MHYLDPRPVTKGDRDGFNLAWANWCLLEAELEADENPSTVTALKLAAALQGQARAARDYVRQKAAEQGIDLTDIPEPEPVQVRLALPVAQQPPQRPPLRLPAPWA